MATKLVIFDCDGTLVDSQHMIVDVMSRAFTEMGLAPPTRAESRSVIGLSLGQALGRLASDLGAQDIQKLQALFQNHYRAAHCDMVDKVEPLYDGIRESILTLKDSGYLLAVATGNSSRGLARILAAHEITDHFVSLQTADYHPSKPHPSMVRTCLADSGAEPEDTLVIGDTSFDMAMARSAGCFALGALWGYHDHSTLMAAGAHHVTEDACALPDVVQTVIGSAQ